MVGQLIRPACYDPAPMQEISIEGRFNPWQNDGIVVAQEDSNGPAVIESSASVLGAGTGKRLFTMDPVDSATWMQVDISVVGSILYRTGEPTPTVDQINGSVIKATPAKILVSLDLAGGTVESFVASVGPGASFAVPPTHRVTIDAVVPNPETDTPELVPVPGDFDRNEFRFASTLRAKATCVGSPSGGGATLQECFYLEGSLAPVPGTESQIPRFAERFRIYKSPAFGNSVAPAVFDTVAEFVQTFTPTAPGAVPPFPSIPVMQIPFDSLFSSAELPIASGFNAIRVRPPGSAPGNNRNVCIEYQLQL
mgnify:CR=1 FL=1